MRINILSIVPLLVLAAMLPFVVAARSPAASDAPFILGTGVVEVTDEATALTALFTPPKGATWVTLRTDSPRILLVGADSGMNNGNSWILAPGEDITFALASPVLLRSSTGTVRARVLVGK